VEGGVRGRQPAVDRHLQQHFLDLVARDAVAERGAQVQPQLVAASVIRLRVRRGSPGRVQISPQA
jgi:hypothetical protein